MLKNWMGIFFTLGEPLARCESCCMQPDLTCMSAVVLLLVGGGEGQEGEGRGRGQGQHRHHPAQPDHVGHPLQGTRSSLQAVSKLFIKAVFGLSSDCL